MLGAPELLIVLAVVLVVFGGTRIPKLARSLGEAKRELDHGIKDGSKKPAEEGPSNCRECGRDIAGDDRFCKSCGASREPVLTPAQRG